MCTSTFCLGILPAIFVASVTQKDVDCSDHHTPILGSLYLINGAIINDIVLNDTHFSFSYSELKRLFKEFLYFSLPSKAWLKDMPKYRLGTKNRLILYQYICNNMNLWVVLQRQ